MRFHVRGVDHLCVCGSSVSSKLPEQVFPDATPRPAHKAIIDRCRRSILGRAIAPATAAFQNMHDTADDAAVVRPLDAPYIRRQMRFDPSPLLVAQPKQVPAHNPDPLPTTNQDRIVRAKKLMSSDPSPCQISVRSHGLSAAGQFDLPAPLQGRPRCTAWDWRSRPSVHLLPKFQVLNAIEKPSHFLTWYAGGNANEPTFRPDRAVRVSDPRCFTRANFAAQAKSG
jgi:hypothetical protein